VPLDVPEQVCITKDNTQLGVDGILYYQVTDPRLASYGSSNYVAAVTQLAQTTLRSEIGKVELDKTFESRDDINRQIVSVLDEAGRNWGIKVLRYEIKSLTPPETILRAVAEAIGDKGGLEAANLKVARQYIEAFANLAKTSNTLIVPASASDVAGFVATAMTVLDKTRQAQTAAKA
jgi:regulator of protease activity HflC (stomatin/prohibitin superfamily)